MDVKIDKASSVCSSGHRPALMSGLIVQELRSHFSREDAIEHPEFRKRLWKADPSQGILIEDFTHWTPLNSGQRLAVIVRRNDWQSRKLTIGSKSGTTNEGDTCYIRLVTGSHTLFCLAKEGIEADLLAAEVYRYFIAFGTEIAKVFELKLFEHVQTGAPGHVREASDRFGVPVSLAYAYSEEWILRSHAPRLKRIAFSQLVQ
jgi:hypothetical protein